MFELILHPATLLKLFISSMSSLVEFYGSLNYTIISSANSDTLTSSFAVYIPLIPFVVLLLWLELQALYWIDTQRVDSLVLSLILVESLQVSLHLIWRCLLVCCMLLLICLGLCLKFLIFTRLLIWNEGWTLWKAISASHDMISCDLF